MCLSHRLRTTTFAKRGTLRKPPVCVSSHTSLFVALEIEIRCRGLILACQFRYQKNRRPKGGEGNAYRQDARDLSSHRFCFEAVEQRLSSYILLFLLVAALKLVERPKPFQSVRQRPVDIHILSGAKSYVDWAVQTANVWRRRQ